MDAAVLAVRFQAVTERTRRVLLRGPASVNGIRSFSRALGIADDCGGSTVNRDVFTSALGDNGVHLTEADVNDIFATFDRSGSGEIDPTEFIAALRCLTSPLRRAWLQRVWLSFRTDGMGNVRVAELQSLYRSERHPDVVRGVRSAEEVADEFLATFNETTNPDGVVSRQEFEEYYVGVSAACYNDDDFSILLRGVWPLVGVSESFTMSLLMGQETVVNHFSAHQSVIQKAGITDRKNQLAELQRVLESEHRPAVLRSPLAVRKLAVAIRAADLGRSTFIPVDAFLSALHLQRMYFQCDTVVRALDTNGDGTVDYLYYLQLLLPVLSSSRMMMLERLWRSLFPRCDEHDRGDIAVLHRQFKAKDGEEKDQFLNSWDVRAARDRRVTFNEMVEWYVPQSSQIRLDKDFEALLKRQWPNVWLPPAL